MDRQYSSGGEVLLLERAIGPGRLRVRASYTKGLAITVDDPLPGNRYRLTIPLAEAWKLVSLAVVTTSRLRGIDRQVLPAPEPIDGFRGLTKVCLDDGAIIGASIVDYPDGTAGAILLQRCAPDGEGDHRNTTEYLTAAMPFSEELLKALIEGVAALETAGFSRDPAKPGQQFGVS